MLQAAMMMTMMLMKAWSSNPTFVTVACEANESQLRHSTSGCTTSTTGRQGVTISRPILSISLGGGQASCPTDDDGAAATWQVGSSGPWFKRLGSKWSTAACRAPWFIFCSSNVSLLTCLPHGLRLHLVLDTMIIVQWLPTLPQAASGRFWRCPPKDTHNDEEGPEDRAVTATGKDAEGNSVCAAGWLQPAIGGPQHVEPSSVFLLPAEVHLVLLLPHRSVC